MRRTLTRLTAVFPLILPALLRAHAGEPPQPHDIWSSWSFEPGTVVALVLTAVLYARGLRVSRCATGREMASFWTGWGLLTLALLSPLHALGASLFSAHMAQHEILMLGSAPLLVFSRPLVPMLWGLPFAWRRKAGAWAKTGPVRKLWRSCTNPLSAWSIHAVVLWLWHFPKFFEATLGSEWIHAAQHVSFLASALLFWWSLWYARGRNALGLGVLYIFTTAIHTSILGALLTLTSKIWYPAYSATTGVWGLTPLEDQQTGGLIMWVPAGLVYLAAGLAMFAAWLRESETAVFGRRYA